MEITPEGLNKVFYSDDGSTAVEAAVKIAFQYWQFKGRPEKQQFINLGDSYHGDTVGAVSVGNIDVFHKVYNPLLFATKKMTCPSFYHSKLGIKTEEEFLKYLLDELETYLKENASHVAAMIIEPLVQAAAGMLMQPKGYIKGVRELTKKYGVLLIVDEVATGFGRTGKMFACEHEGVLPDLMCMSKGITCRLAQPWLRMKFTMLFWANRKTIKLFITDIPIQATRWRALQAWRGLKFLPKIKLLQVCLPKWQLLKNIWKNSAKCGMLATQGSAACWRALN